MAHTFPKCPKCRTRFVDEPGELCAACSFRPQVGKLMSGRRRPGRDKGVHVRDLEHEAVEDDYGDESDADSTAWQRSEPHKPGERRPE